MNESMEFVVSRASEIEELRKALEVGYQTSPENQAGFGATRLESLQATLKYATEKEKTSKFWLALQKGKGNSTVEEFTVVDKIGSASFYTEGGLPEEYDEVLKRELEFTKYVGTVGRVPNVALSVKSQVNNMATVQKLKAIAMIRLLDIKSFFANSANISVEFNGYLAQFMKRVKRPDQNIIDAKGSVLTPSMLNKVGAIVEGNFGDPMNLKGWISVDTFTNYAESLIKNKTFMVGNNAIRDITSVPKTWEMGNGSGSLETDLHLRHKGQTNLDETHPKLNSNNTAFASTHSKAPLPLTVGTATVTPTVDATSTLPAGTYDYCFLAVNRYGASAGFEKKGVVIAEGESAVFGLADAGSPAGQVAECFEVYRKPASKPGLTDYQFLETIPASASVMKDDGSEIPGTTYGFFFDWDFDQVLTFLQLLPMVKQPLAVIDDSIRWLQKIYGTPILFNPNKMVLIKNIGTSDPA